MDLNLVRTFVAVYEARSLTGAASVLFVTQPAVSQALGRLRRELHDELFLRSGRSMAPTPYADELYAKVRQSLSHIDEAVDAVVGFDPATSTRRFRIALSELGEVGFLPLIMAAVRARAPGVHLEVVPFDPERFEEQLVRGVIDLAVSSGRVPRGLDGVTLKNETYVALMSEGHRLARGRMTVGRYASSPRVELSTDPGRAGVRAALRRHGHDPDPRLIANHWSAVPLLLATSDLVATVPGTMAEEWARSWPLRYRQLPFRTEEVPVTLHARIPHREAPALVWLRTTVLDSVRHGTVQVVPTPRLLELSR